MICNSDPHADQVRPSVPPWILDGFYIGALAVTLPWLLVARKRRLVVDHLRRRARAMPRRDAQRPCLWLHGVSAGEILSARRFVELFESEYPDWDVVVSATTRAGVEVGSIHFAGRPVITYPFDLGVLVRRAFDRVRPDVVAIVEHELWPNFLEEARRRGVPVALVNGRLSERSFQGYRKLSRWITWPPRGLARLCVEDTATARGFHRLGVPPDRVHVTGNLKFDACLRDNPSLRSRLGYHSDSWVLVAASTHRGEEELVVDAFENVRRRCPSARIVLAPRRVDRVAEVAALLRRRGLRALRWSELARRLACDTSTSVPPVVEPGPRDALVVDTVGELGDLLSVGDAVFVGGSLVPFGGHNVIEPASLAKPVLTGPHHGSFASVVEAFLANDALSVVADPEELASCLARLERDVDLAEGMARRALATVRQHSGASARTLDALRPLFEARRRPLESIRAAAPGARARASGKAVTAPTPRAPHRSPCAPIDAPSRR